MKIVKTIKGNEELVNNYEHLYIEDIRVSYKLYHDSIDITNIDPAMKRGSICRQVIISKNSNLGYDERRINFMTDIVENNKDYTLEQLLLNPNFINQSENISFIVRNLRSKDVYSPFWKPAGKVKIKKDKFTLTDIKKMLMNGQIEKRVFKDRPLTIILTMPRKIFIKEKR